MNFEYYFTNCVDGIILRKSFLGFRESGPDYLILQCFYDSNIASILPLTLKLMKNSCFFESPVSDQSSKSNTIASIERLMKRKCFPHYHEKLDAV